MSRKRKAYATNVQKYMVKQCPTNCPGKSYGVEKDTDGKVLRVFDCKNICKLNRRN